MTNKIEEEQKAAGGAATKNDIDELTRIVEELIKKFEQEGTYVNQMTQEQTKLRSDLDSFKNEVI